ncbi:hypothetical protein L211DRAFT_866109 [Terfezia boudieri ATCC MYA-4762]|uniref:Uncharacterized protein n=1 Tax=Terfezia boudieri ATCC MYA-4762 TaxID=1051890 RepID=A0A3N4M1H2_9PEZI|nr:hypothetical protein L211DRAFT_866109 [Terfezia boudieri ATCC MYA-4762]
MGTTLDDQHSGPEGQSKRNLASTPNPYAAPPRTEQSASSRSAVETNRPTYAKVAMSGQHQSPNALILRHLGIPQSVINKGQRERLDNRREREEYTASTPAPKNCRTSGDGDTRKVSRDNHGKVEELEEEGVLLGIVELGESLQEREVNPVRSGNTHSRGRPIDRERDRMRIKELSAQLQRLEAQSDEYRLQIEKMAQINQQLARQGLPLPPADDYFSRELGELWSDIGGWARLASKRQVPITTQVWRSLSDETRATISPAFADVEELLAAKPSVSLRARFMELIIFKNLQAWIFGRHVLGLNEEVDSRLAKLWQSMIDGNSTTERDVHCWNALSIHLLTKDIETFQASRESDVDALSTKLSKWLEPLGAPGATTFDELHQIVSHAANIGLQIAKLPFRIHPLEIPPGMPFQQRLFEDVIGDDIGPQELEIASVPISLVLFPPVVKLEFDSEGKMMNLEAIHAGQDTVISKGRVVCCR